MSRHRHPTESVLRIVVCVQAAAGVPLSIGCLCAPHFRRVGFFLAVGLAGYVAVSLFLAGWARRRPLQATLGAVALYVTLLAAMQLPSVSPSLPAWIAQIPAGVLLLIATATALRSARTPHKPHGPPHGAEAAWPQSASS